MPKGAVLAACLLCLGACSRDNPQPASAAIQAKLDTAQRRLDSMRRAEQLRVADSIRVERTTPRKLALESDTVHVPPPSGQSHGFVAAGFSLASRGSCKVSGRVEVIDGGNKDLIVAIFTEDQFINWKNNPQGRGQALFAAGPQTMTSIDVPVSDTGAYYFVLSNRFSTVTSKTAIANVEAVCIGSPVPAAVKAP